jgi:phage-related tail protein
MFYPTLQEAQQRLEEAHREKVTRVMKDWSDLEERYQDMRLADPKSAQAFKQKMTARFQVVKNSNIGAHEDIKEINFVFFCPLLDIRSGT